MKRFLLLVFLFASFSTYATNLNPGEVIITGYNADNADQFTFVLLVETTAGTVVKFTDKAWNNTTSAFSGSEGIVVWESDQDLPCGTEITITKTAGNIFVPSIGLITNNPTGNFLLNATGEQILVFRGSQASPIFLYGISFRNTGWTYDVANNNTTSDLPPSLTLGTSALDLGANVSNAKYNCTTTTTTANIVADAGIASNWLTSTTRFTNLSGCGYTCDAANPCGTVTATWASGAWQGGILPDLTKTVVLNDNYDTATQTSFSACSLTISAGVTLNISDNTFVEVERNVDNSGTVYVHTAGTFIQNSNVENFINNAAGTSSVIKETALINNWYEYTYWSSPVTGETVEDAFFTANPDRRFYFNAANFADLFYEVGNNNTLTAYSATDTLDDIDDNGDDWQYASGIMTPGVGYAATLSPTSFSIGGGSGNNFAHIFSGPFNNGLINVAVVRNDDSSTSAIPDNNWNFIGNPYPSAIDVDLFMAANQYSTSNTDGTLDGSIYLWSQNTPPSNNNNGNQQLNFSDADYAVINGIGETAGGDGITPTRHIASGQGFFVNYDDNATTPGTVVFNNGMRVKANNNLFFRNSNTATAALNNENDNFHVEKLRLNLTSDNGVFNQILIAYNTLATNDFDGAYYDAVKNLSSNTAVKFGSKILNNPNLFAIQAKNISDLNENEIVPLAFSTSINVATLYTISIVDVQGNFLANNPIYLKDNLNSTIHDLTASDYNFTSVVGEFNNRFEIVFNNASLSIDNNEITSNNLSIIELENDNIMFKVDQNFTIQSIQIFDTLGKEVYNFKGENSTETYNMKELSSSLYIAKVTLNNGQTITKKAIKK
ncbi:MAG TPA: T9SS type A sorting domain-containing protein [Flavobacteriaceae bacterium]|nr:T9SS type A sorting domain-containing protein [Flavobacteriaceae bacterium]